ncbi:hypothetical protein [Paenibacillus thermotolerans]|uniref:hypothetical protein n=1 Tax=Paenibacillus thermotolerans TaxID=3027807 RepID=UPI00236896BA|nr:MULTISPECIES: hypothetical protein [unclassified Paenibacillus]
MVNPTTPNIGLNKVDRSSPSTTTFNTKPIIDDNAEIIDGLFEETTGHKHDGTAGNGPKLDPTTALTYIPVNKAGDTITGDITQQKDMARYVFNRTTGALNGYAGFVFRDDGVAKGQLHWDYGNNKFVFIDSVGNVYDFITSKGGQTINGNLTISGPGDTKLILKATDADNYSLIQAQNSAGSSLGSFGFAGDKWVIDGNQIWHDGNFQSRSGLRAYMNAAQALSAATWTTVNWDAESYDWLGEMDLSTNRFTASKSGVYSISGALYFGTGASAENMQGIRVRQYNSAGTNIATISMAEFKSYGAGAAVLPFHCELPMTASDWVVVDVYSQDGRTINAGSGFSYLIVHRMS